MGPASSVVAVGFPIHLRRCGLCMNDRDCASLRIVADVLLALAIVGDSVYVILRIFPALIVRESGFVIGHDWHSHMMIATALADAQILVFVAGITSVIIRLVVVKRITQQRWQQTLLVVLTCCVLVVPIVARYSVLI